ncbi:hypothetical protein C0Q70_13236 [Pomacea canaliculata]|uniref:MD-2-related lipid-recognition domain-containing protein n=1 Tax=Pomacea canaliculata TaxID=400727 RepID=A0A2T7NWN4_POMCA|nr:hypothetical protein C0Q70_13236 [Pomacea canaliculata]
MSGYIVVLCIIATAFVAVYGDELQLCPLKYEDCGSGLSRVLDAHYSGTECPSEGDPAELPKGSTVQLFVDFIPRSGLSKIINVLFSGIDCPSEGAPAVVPRGSTVQVYAEFIPHVSTPTLTASIHACLGFICLPFPLAPTDACQDSNITCPVKSGVQYTYAPVIQIKNYLPWVSACVKWELKGARGEVIGCVKFPVKIV